MNIWYLIWFLAGMLTGAVVDWVLVWVITARRVKAAPDYHQPQHAPSPEHESAQHYIE